MNRIDQLLQQMIAETSRQTLPTVYSATMLAGLQELHGLTAGIEAQRAFAQQAAQAVPVAQEPGEDWDGEVYIGSRTPKFTSPPAAEQPDDTAMPGVLELLRERRELDGDARYLFGDDRVWAEKADAFLVSTAAEQPACPGCNGHGLVGGFVSAESGYDAEECPFCCGDGFIHGTECGACAEQPDTVAVRRKLLEDMHIAIADYVAGSRRSRLESLTRSKELRVAERRVWLAARALLGKAGE